MFQSRVSDPPYFDADPDPDPGKNLLADPDPDPDPGVNKCISIKFTSNGLKRIINTKNICCPFPPYIKIWPWPMVLFFFSVSGHLKLI